MSKVTVTFSIYIFGQFLTDAWSLLVNYGSAKCARSFRLKLQRRYDRWRSFGWVGWGQVQWWVKATIRLEVLRGVENCLSDDEVHKKIDMMTATTTTMQLTECIVRLCPFTKIMVPSRTSMYGIFCGQHGIESRFFTSTLDLFCQNYSTSALYSYRVYPQPKININVSNWQHS